MRAHLSVAVLAEPEVFHVRVQPGDRLLIACDGVWDVVPPNEIPQRILVCSISLLPLRVSMCAFPRRCLSWLSRRWTIRRRPLRASSAWPSSGGFGRRVTVIT
jgi:hypothetical protein